MDNGADKGLLQMVLDNLKPVLDGSLDAIRKGYEQTGKLRASIPPERTSLEIYDIEVFQSLSAVESAISRLRQGITYVENYPGDIKGHETVHTQYDWSQYHYAFFVSTVVSIPDLLLMLINSVFALGNPERYCKRDIILKNKWIRDTELPGRFKELENVVHPYRESRNRLIHRGRMPNLPTNSEDSLLDYLSFFNVLLQAKMDIISPELIHEAWQNELPKLTIHLASKVEEINSSVVSVLDALLLHYSAIREQKCGES